MTYLRLRFSVLSFGVLVACGGDAGPTDSGVDGAADAAADLGPRDAGGDGAPCTTDDDVDGHRSLACGGDDCDDSDPNRYPGNTEVCDSANHDDDCDARTFGFRDADSDGYADALCCNVDGITMNCGDDCNDASPPTHPTANETCNGRDDDCNGVVDDVHERVSLDCDGDGFGDATDPAHTVFGCAHDALAGECATPATTAGWIAAAGDCDDGAAGVHPGATEACDGTVDDNCSGLVDEGCACTAGATRPCGITVGACHAGTQSCIAGAWETSCGGGFVGSSTESCNRIDDDCDGLVDEENGSSHTYDFGIFTTTGWARMGNLEWSVETNPLVGFLSPSPSGPIHLVTSTDVQSAYAKLAAHPGSSFVMPYGYADMNGLFVADMEIGRYGGVCVTMLREPVAAVGSPAASGLPDAVGYAFCFYGIEPRIAIQINEGAGWTLPVPWTVMPACAEHGTLRYDAYVIPDSGSTTSATLSMDLRLMDGTCETLINLPHARWGELMAGHEVQFGFSAGNNYVNAFGRIDLQNMQVQLQNFCP